MRTPHLQIPRFGRSSHASPSNHGVVRLHAWRTRPLRRADIFALLLAATLATAVLVAFWVSVA